ncbi:MAG: 50S ribosomal protein L21 [Coriobacteriia bacterium]
MYAVVNTGGKQAKVEVGTVVAIEKLEGEVGSTVSLPVIFIADGDVIMATPSDLVGASVTAELLEHFKGDKQIIFKLKKRKGYKRTKGHRQHLTAVRITDITVPGAAKPAKAEKPEKAAKAAKAEKPVEDAPVAAPAPVAKAASTEVAPEMCAATKSDGTPCQNKAKEGSKYCGVHAKQHEGE